MSKFFCDIPSLESNSDGNIEIIHKYSVGPIETITYGITGKKEFYLDWQYPEFGDEELVRDYRVISKERILKAIELEIGQCRKDGNLEAIKKYELAKHMIDQDY